MDGGNTDDRVAVKIIGGAIRELREARRLTLERLAGDAGISYQYLSGIETGKENFSIAILEKIARGLDVPIVALIAAAYGWERDTGASPRRVNGKSTPDG